MFILFTFCYLLSHFNNKDAERTSHIRRTSNSELNKGLRCLPNKKHFQQLHDVKRNNYSAHQDNNHNTNSTNRLWRWSRICNTFFAPAHCRQWRNVDLQLRLEYFREFSCNGSGIGRSFCIESANAAAGWKFAYRVSCNWKKGDKKVLTRHRLEEGCGKDVNGFKNKTEEQRKKLLVLRVIRTIMK